MLDYTPSPINPYSILMQQEDSFPTEKEKIENDISMYEYAGNMVGVYYSKKRLSELEIGE